MKTTKQCYLCDVTYPLDQFPRLRPDREKRGAKCNGCRQLQYERAEAKKKSKKGVGRGNGEKIYIIHGDEIYA